MLSKSDELGLVYFGSTGEHSGVFAKISSGEVGNVVQLLAAVLFISSVVSGTSLSQVRAPQSVISDGFGRYL